MDEERYAFEVTWYDNLAEISRRFMLMYFVRHTGDNEVEMIDLKTNKKFLKRCPYSSITLQDLYIGSTVSIFSRQLHVVAYSDPFTQRVLGSRQSKTLGIVAAAGIKHLGKALSASAAAGLSVKNLRMLYLSADEAASVFPSRGDLNGVFSDAAIVIELVGENASSQWSNIASSFPSSAFFGSNSSVDAEREISALFGSKPAGSNTVTFDNCTLCVIKPHIVRDGKVGDIITAITDAGFEVSALQSFNLNRVTAEEFLEVYKGVLPEFSAYVEEMSSGTCVALEVRAEDAVNVFRQFVGPHEVEIAKHIRPQTLRARFGSDKVKNAVHCTDLEEDGSLEVEYFFSILGNAH